MDDEPQGRDAPPARPRTGGPPLAIAALRARQFLRALTALVVTAFATTAPAAIYFVSPEGSDTHDGLALQRPLRTIQTAANRTQPGDTVYLLDGTHAPVDDNQARNSLVSITRSGTPEAWITYTAYPGHAPRVFGTGWSVFTLSGGASYIEISRLEIVGNNANLALADARAQPTRSPYDSRFNTNGITIDGRRDGANKPHHIRVLNNVIRDLPAGGVAAIQCDWLWIEGNHVYNTSWFTIWASSGISVYQPWDYDAFTGYKIFIRYNECHDNRTQVPWVSTGQLSDGNGIIWDDSRHTQNGSTLGPYRGRALIANNLSYHNGGSGAHSYSSERCDILHNTLYRNGQVVGYPDLFASESTDVRLANNLVVTRPGARGNANNRNTDVVYSDNLYFDDAGTVVFGPTDRRADPLFVRPPAAPGERGDFRLQAFSPALDRANPAAGASDDFFRRSRPVGAGPDLGAIEMPAPAPSPAARISNLSTRSFAGTDGDVQIAGFVLGGAGPTQVLVRAAGPALRPFGVADALDDPVLEVFDAAGRTLASNDDWVSGEVAGLFPVVGAFAWQPGSRDSAVALTLPPGAYTAHVSGRQRGTGSALIELYELSPQRFVNISTRGRIRAAGDALVAGFVVPEPAPQRVLIRGLGPALVPFGLTDALREPVLTLHDAAGGVLARTTGWSRQRAEIVAASVASGAGALSEDAADAALVLTLAPGSYTAHVAGANGGTGVALVEVYRVP